MLFVSSSPIQQQHSSLQICGKSQTPFEKQGRNKSSLKENIAFADCAKKRLPNWFPVIFKPNVLESQKHTWHAINLTFMTQNSIAKEVHMTSHGIFTISFFFIKTVFLFVPLPFDPCLLITYFFASTILYVTYHLSILHNHNFTMSIRRRDLWQGSESYYNPDHLISRSLQRMYCNFYILHPTMGSGVDYGTLSWTL